MKSVLRLGTCCLLLLFYKGGYAQNPSLEVSVNNIKSERGDILIGLFTSQDDFLKNAVTGKTVKATGKEVTVLFEDLKPGDYAVSVIHDENGNGELDTNKLGIPKEGFAFGNNAMGKFGPPTFDKAKIVISDQAVQQVIQLKYY